MTDLHILCLIHSLDGGGAERVMAGLASRLVGRGHKVTLVTMDDGQSDRHAVDEAVQRRFLDVMAVSGGPVSAIMNLRRRVLAIRTAIADAKPDVVLSFCDRTNVLAVMATQGMLPGRHGTGNVPVVISERSDPSQQCLGTAYEWLRRQTYRRADRIIAQTQASADFLQSLLPRPREPHPAKSVDVIPSAVDIPVVYSDRSVASSSERIISIGRLEREKGFDRLLEAMGEIAVRHPGWQLTILGEGSQRSALTAQARSLGIETRLSMPGWVSPVWSPLSEAAIYVMPSRYEGFPSALMEAMAAGVPSVAVDCPSGPEAIVDSQQNGLLVTNDVAGIVGGIEQMITDPERRESMGQAGRDVLQTFGWDRMVDQYLRILLDAVCGRGVRR
ncbi:N-acetylgalactosamine-N,N'-diacetylbacillosaminyl-diphospho-undecaprenol 4-alpha-N-acetylgalactosaminyltransferase [Rubripirellula lacrimiformis]|uniref:N-acetylgalactosamine-N, N'-diacetylbacillosaminyl-diphospho-undecaprenol 4-alpha-N-acetylgalactosaminyltransferase n=1 Tax=Rubripirellula lacrimiformis TaxID=1930273 RepID=A0A517NG68_9BACT|nr:glycosyltransferase family 4 protein [Rubripirellula lacrimiformis]QDT06129.1 N-acetylgalactosamine-N,N'-diacetylbacillosaminyl-diphospho-undecaprenol 4-alpha-N-acetylgalactosaminyltransferase [Rubripirellula lacrimiformis]